MCVCYMWTSRYECSILRVQQGAAILEVELEVFGNCLTNSQTLVLCKLLTTELSLLFWQKLLVKA